MPSGDGEGLLEGSLQGKSRVRNRHASFDDRSDGTGKRTKKEKRTRVTPKSAPVGMVAGSPSLKRERDGVDEGEGEKAGFASSPLRRA